MKFATIAMLLIFSSLSYAQPEVEISSERDARGKFVNPAALTVTWETEADGVTLKEYAAADVSDHCSTDDDTLQEWFVPKPNALVYWKFTFTRESKGEYAVRWRPGADSLWSEWESVTITGPEPPRHKD